MHRMFPPEEPPSHKATLVAEQIDRASSEYGHTTWWDGMAIREVTAHGVGPYYEIEIADDSADSDYALTRLQEQLGVPLKTIHIDTSTEDVEPGYYAWCPNATSITTIRLCTKVLA